MEKTIQENKKHYYHVSQYGKDGAKICGFTHRPIETASELFIGPDVYLVDKCITGRGTYIVQARASDNSPRVFTLKLARRSSVLLELKK